MLSSDEFINLIISLLKLFSVCIVHIDTISCIPMQTYLHTKSRL